MLLKGATGISYFYVECWCLFAVTWDKLLDKLWNWFWDSMSLILHVCHPYDVTIKIFSFPQRVEKVEVSKKDLNEKRSGSGPAWERAEYWNRAEKVEVSRSWHQGDVIWVTNGSMMILFIHRFYSQVNMMTSSNGNIFRVTGPLCGEFTGPGEFPSQRPVTRSFNVFFDLHLNKRLSKQSRGWQFETPSRPLWRHCNANHSNRPRIRLLLIVLYSIQPYFQWKGLDVFFRIIE